MNGRPLLKWTCEKCGATFYAPYSKRRKLILCHDCKRQRRVDRQRESRAYWRREFKRRKAAAKRMKGEG